MTQPLPPTLLAAQCKKVLTACAMLGDIKRMLKSPGVLSVAEQEVLMTVIQQVDDLIGEVRGVLGTARWKAYELEQEKKKAVRATPVSGTARTATP